MRKLGLFGVMCALIVAGMALTGCQSPQGAFDDPGLGGDAGVQASTADNPDILNPGDNLIIQYSDLPGGSPQPPFEGPVRQDGTITLLHNQTFMAAGKTRGQLEKEIRERYVPRFFLNMTVTIKPQDRFFFVGGEVKAPGRQIYLGQMSIIKAIQSAGDFTEFANKKNVIVFRGNGRREVVNVPKALKNPKLDLEVFPGDKIHVPRRIW